MPRLFAALEMPYQASMALSMLKGGLYGARWIDPENYHLTLRFIGDVEHHMADEILRSLDGVKRRDFTMGLSGLNAFGGKKPHSLYAMPTASTDLMTLQSTIARKCEQLGLAPDTRKFTPHVTVARLRDISASAVADYLSVRGGFFVPQFPVKRFVLMSSKDSVGGGPYVIEESYELAPSLGGSNASTGTAGIAASPSWMWR